MHIAPFLDQKTKIICTMGPAIGSEEKIIELLHAGANAFRLNMSHGSHSVHKQYVDFIRAAEKKIGFHIPIIADLQGPKIRVSDLPNGSVPFMTGRDVYFADTAAFRSKKIKLPDDTIPIEYPTFAKDVKKGDFLLFDDGLLKAEVRATDGIVVKAVVINGGTLKSRKGLNLPSTSVSQPALSDKDKKDVLFAIENGCDYVALSFVRNAKDVQLLQRFLAHHGSSMWICSKIEKPEAVNDLDNIVKASNAIMVARGDLGVEIPAAQVPTVQKRIIALCNMYGKPVITATQMLESMMQNPRPTRAEASDVANAVYDGTDGVMLSAETSVGAYPIDTVAYMRMICSEAERALLRDDARLRRHVQGLPQKEQNTDLIAAAAASIAEDERIHAIATLSLSGETALLISNKRPVAPIIAVTELPNIARRVGLFWGTTGVLMDNVTTTDDTIEDLKKMLVKKHYLHSGMQIVVTIGRPLVARSRTNMLSIEKLP
ncbi:MAG TPA: pyruvate kinase [Candidatus Kapabacteria bacterium]|nr:pyruvate kinase [Candidatus Kapabacteria bacterium]